MKFQASLILLAGLFACDGGGADATDGSDTDMSATNIDQLFKVDRATRNLEGCGDRGDDYSWEPYFRLVQDGDTINYYACPRGADDCDENPNTLYQTELEANGETAFLGVAAAGNLKSGADKACRRQWTTTEIVFQADGGVKLRWEDNVDDSQPYFPDEADCLETIENWSGSGAVCVETRVVDATPEG
ncbi:MAG: hypothetical protein ACON5B_18295 [Myxococcota bacterium]